ncbi:MAG: efflux RND transporter permease subunit, partial [Candidatus Methylomirabilis sp.]|nr:efflux RND transporter permease subunit [Deltaproteobacteria bacterium]
MTMVFLALAVFGWQSLKKLPLNLMPDITYPSLTVRTEMEGAAPEEVEDLISEPVEEALGTVSDLVQISSTSSAGASEVVLEFAWDKNMDFAVLDVREKLDRVLFPKEAERPLILRYNPSLDPIMRIGVYGDLDLFELRELAEEEIKRELEGISGVASAQVKGGLEEEIRIEVDEARAARLGVTVLGVGEQLALQNINLAGGKLKEGKVEYLVRTLNEFLDPKEIEDIVVGGASGGADVVRLRDVASVRRDHRDRKTITRIGGREAVLVSIYKEADANTVAAVRAVRDKMAELFGEKAAAAPAPAGADKGLVRQVTLAANIPEGARYEVISDQARFIESAIAEVKDAAVQGGALSVLVLLLFLRDWRSTLILALSLPISVIITLIPMFALGTSMNIMSLGGLALGIGMLVDNGVVVIENIFRLREEGVPIRQAASRGVSEVSGPIISGTFTNVAVFLPIVFVEGVAGQLFWDFAVTVTFSVLASLLPALFLVPMLVAQQQALEEWA